MTLRDETTKYLEFADATLVVARELLCNHHYRDSANRAYYAMFYGIIALLIHENIEHKTSKHSGIISIFDKSIVHTGKMGREYSRMLHRIFNARQESDYKEFVRFTNDDAAEYLRVAEEFLRGIKALIAASKNS